MASKKDYIRTVDALISLTQDGSMVWSRSDTPLNLLSNGNRISHVYTSLNNGQLIRVYEEMYRQYTDENEYFFQKEITIELLDQNGNAIFRFPYTRNTQDLFNAIQYKNSGIDSFINNLIG